MTTSRGTVHRNNEQARTSQSQSFNDPATLRTCSPVPLHSVSRHLDSKTGKGCMLICSFVYFFFFFLHTALPWGWNHLNLPAHEKKPPNSKSKHRARCCVLCLSKKAVACYGPLSLSLSETRHTSHGLRWW